MKAKLIDLGWTAMFIAGSALVVYGVSRWSVPAAFVVAGLEIAVIGFLSGLDPARYWRTDELDED